MRITHAYAYTAAIFRHPHRPVQVLIRKCAMSSSRVYIGRLSYQAREKDVERFFRGFGRIRDINLKNGFGFVEFEDSRDSDDAVYELNGRELLGERVLVEHARGSSSGFGRRSFDRGGGGGGGGDRGGGRYSQGGGDRGGPGAPAWLAKYGPPTRTEYRITVENISSRVSWQDLKDFMRSAGDITYADAHKQRVGEGVVEYATYEDMKNALRKLDGAELNGRRIRLAKETQSSSSYRGGGGRGRSRSRSHSHGRSRSRSHSRSRSRSRDRSHSRDRTSRRRSRSASHSRGSRSPSRSRSRSRSPDRRNRSRSQSRSRSRSGSPAAQKVSSPQRNGSPRRSRSRSHSRSRSRSRSASGSPLPKSPANVTAEQDTDMRSRSATPPEEGSHDE